MIVKYTLHRTKSPRHPLTPEQIAAIEDRAPADSEILYDEDCPPMTEEQLSQFQPIDPRTGHAPQPKAAGN